MLAYPYLFYSRKIFREVFSILNIQHHFSPTDFYAGLIRIINSATQKERECRCKVKIIQIGNLKNINQQSKQFFRNIP